MMMRRAEIEAMRVAVREAVEHHRQGLARCHVCGAETELHPEGLDAHWLFACRAHHICVRSAGTA